MTNSAFLFPGQGCQVVGMGKEFFDNFSVSKQVFEEVDDALSGSLSKMIFEGPKEDLDSTENTQVALMTVSIAIYRAMMQELGADIASYCDVMAGHSLGEYTAHVAAGSIHLSDCAKALQHRGSYMSNSCPGGSGGMAACIAIGTEELQAALDAINMPNNHCQIANDNSPGQIVISGNIEAIDRAVKYLKEQRVKAIKLNVSAAFHSQLMLPAAEKMTPILSNLQIHKPRVPIITNYKVQPSQDVAFLRQELMQQICGKVSWRQTIDLMISQGITRFVEIGCGNVLSNMLKRSWKDHDIEVVTISNIEQMKLFLKSQ